MSARRVLAAALTLELALGGCATPAPTPVTGSPAPAPTSAPSEALGSPEATSSASTTVATATPAETPPPPVIALAPAPTNCLPSGPPDRMPITNFGGGFSDGNVFLGRAPVWTLGLPADGILHVPAPSGDARFPNAKVMWIIGPAETQAVTIRGNERSTGDPLWFQVYPSNTAASLPSSYTTTLTLDPATPNRGYAQNDRGTWSIWGIGVGARTAGCYRMTVNSSKGSWTIRLSVGS